MKGFTKAVDQHQTFGTHLEPGGRGLQALDLGVLQGGVGGDGGKQLQDLGEPSLEGVKLPEDVHLAEVELPLRRRLLQLLLGLVEIPLVLLYIGGGPCILTLWCFGEIVFYHI